MMETIHLFENGGLGKAPYKYMGCEDTGKCSASCQYCSTGIRYKFYLQSQDGNNFFVGSDCIYKSGDQGLTTIVKLERNRLDKEKREAKRRQAQEQRQAQKEAILKSKIDSFYEQNESIKDVLDWASNSTGVARSIMDNLKVWGSLTEKQIQFLCKLHLDSQKVAVNCPQGKQIVEGTVRSFRLVAGFHGATVLKMTVDANDGYCVFGTVPSKFKNVVAGDRVRFIANIQPSDKDQSFGFFSRPSKAEVIQSVLV
jgi:ribosomal protein L9